MTIKLDLFKLHDPKKDARSRGWITLGGKEVIKETRNILLRLLRRNRVYPNSYNSRTIKNIFSYKI